MGLIHQILQALTGRAVRLARVINEIHADPERDHVIGARAVFLVPANSPRSSKHAHNLDGGNTMPRGVRNVSVIELNTVNPHLLQPQPYVLRAMPLYYRGQAEGRWPAHTLPSPAPLLLRETGHPTNTSGVTCKKENLTCALRGYCEVYQVFRTVFH